MNSRVAVFFYGSYINPLVLAEADLRPASFEVARLRDFDIVIRPLANLVARPGHTVYGVLTAATHPELERLYRHAAEILGGVYLPEAVLVETDSGAKPALCYLSHTLEPAPASDSYIDRIVAPARDFGFPETYIEQLESFRPAPRER